MSDDGRDATLRDLLNYVEGIRRDTKVAITISLDNHQWEVTAQDIKDILATIFYEVPTLKENLEDVLLTKKQLSEWKSQITFPFERPKWEYWETPFNLAMNYISHFNKKGAEGWELINCDFGKGKALFKRLI